MGQALSLIQSVGAIMVKVLGEMSLADAMRMLREDHCLAVLQKNINFKTMLVSVKVGTASDIINELMQTGKFIAGPPDWFPYGEPVSIG